MIDYIVEESCEPLNFPAWGDATNVLDIVNNSSTEVCDTAREIIESMASACGILGEHVTDYDINDYIWADLSDALEEKGYICVCYDGISYFTKAD